MNPGPLALDGDALNTEPWRPSQPHTHLQHGNAIKMSALHGEINPVCKKTRCEITASSQLPFPTFSPAPDGDGLEFKCRPPQDVHTLYPSQLAYTDIGRRKRVGLSEMRVGYWMYEIGKTRRYPDVKGLAFQTLKL